MEWQVTLALAVAIPVVLIPVALVWYLSFGGIYEVVKRARKRGTARRETGARQEA